MTRDLAGKQLTRMQPVKDTMIAAEPIDFILIGVRLQFKHVLYIFSLLRWY